MRKKGVFITFEGTDGVGKSTQIKLLGSWLEQRGHRVVCTREPGGGDISERIRQILLDPASKIDPLTELFLYEAARSQHVANIIAPALSDGQVVLCDRFTDATSAYQGFARGLGKRVDTLNAIATSGLQPDLTILLNLPAEKGLERARQLKSGSDRLENEGPAFQKKVQTGYLRLARREPKRIKVVAVQATVEATQQRIRDIVERSLRGYSRPSSRAALSNGRS